MDTAIEQEQLEKMLDQAVREVTEKAGGVQLHRGSSPPAEEICTVHITFKKGFHSSLTLCAEMSMLTRMASRAVRKDSVSAQDVEDFSKEYFNVLCGRIAALLYRAAKVPARFSVPAFYRGRFKPEGQREQFTLNYASDQQEGVQLTHYVPCQRADTDTDQ